MSKTVHTPGPWEYGVREEKSIWLSIGNPRLGRHYQSDIWACEADARLIAASPDLLEALKEMSSAIRECAPFKRGDIYMSDVLAAADAAIAKAEGSSL